MEGGHCGCSAGAVPHGQHQEDELDELLDGGRRGIGEEGPGDAASARGQDLRRSHGSEQGDVRELIRDKGDLKGDKVSMKRFDGDTLKVTFPVKAVGFKSQSEV